MNNIYTDKWGPAYAGILWIAGISGLCFLCAGLILMDAKLLLFGGLSIFSFRKDIIYFSKNSRVFLVTLILQIVLNSILIAIGVSHYHFQLFIITMAITAIWSVSFSLYFSWLFFSNSKNNSN